MDLIRNCIPLIPQRILQINGNIKYIWEFEWFRCNVNCKRTVSTDYTHITYTYLRDNSIVEQAWLGHQTMDFQFWYNYPCIFNGHLKLLCNPTLDTYQIHLFSGRWLVFLISTHCLSKFSDQSESVFHLFLVSYWLNVLHFPVSYTVKPAKRISVW